MKKVNMEKKGGKQKGAFSRKPRFRLNRNQSQTLRIKIEPENDGLDPLSVVCSQVPHYSSGV